MGALPLCTPRADGELVHTLDDARGERVVVVPREVLLRELHVVIIVELPEAAVDHVEVLVREEGGGAVDVVVSVKRAQRGWERRALERGARDLGRAAPRDGVQDAQYHRLHIPLLKLGRRLEEGEARVVLDNGSHERAQCHRVERARAGLAQRVEQARAQREAAEPLGVERLERTRWYTTCIAGRCRLCRCPACRVGREALGQHARSRIRELKRPLHQLDGLEHGHARLAVGGALDLAAHEPRLALALVCRLPPERQVEGRDRARARARLLGCTGGRLILCVVACRGEWPLLRRECARRVAAGRCRRPAWRCCRRRPARAATAAAAEGRAVVRFGVGDKLHVRGTRWLERDGWRQHVYKYRRLGVGCAWRDCLRRTRCYSPLVRRGDRMRRGERGGCHRLDGCRQRIVIVGAGRFGRAHRSTHAAASMQLGRAGRGARRGT
mmetsp:Transcript_16578/g.42963  ORF Transcript_16578/g.42963 Transcript_16578/m.42963 type:complete len:441 (+) Transcript_16578:794-2116(+)